MMPTDEVLSQIKLPFELHQYQRDDVDRLAPRHSIGYYYKMGIGKTVVSTVTGVYKLLHGYNTVIVLAPASLITQWVDFLTLMDLTVCAYRGTPTERKSLNIDADFVVMSYQIFQKDVERLRRVRKPYFIVDEATVLCNTNNILYKLLNGGQITKRTKFGIDHITVSKVVDGCCLLTGTPVNKPTDAYGLIKMTNPDAYRSKYKFDLQHVSSFDQYNNPVGYRCLDVIHKNLIENAIIREVSDHIDLPDKIYNVIKYELSKKHMALYKKLVEERLILLDDKIAVDALEANSIYHWAQKVIFNPEFVGCDEEPEGLNVIDTLIENVDQVVIFNHYVMTNDKMVKRYNAGGCYGSFSRSEQDKAIKEFQAGRLKVLTANTRSAGYGLNLQVCNQIIFGDVPITPRDFLQAESRCWRQGQKERVVITVLVAKGTIQTKLFSTIMEKDDQMTAVTQSKESLRKALLGA